MFVFSTSSSFFSTAKLCEGGGTEWRKWEGRGSDGSIGEEVRRRGKEMTKQTYISPCAIDD